MIYQSIIQSINQHIYNAPWYRGACYSADYAEAKKCLKPDLKCVNRCSSSTVQRKRVPESWSSKRETTSSSVQVVRRNWQKLLCGRPQRTRLTVRGWLDQQGSLAVEKRSPDNKVLRVWNWSAAGLAANAGSVAVVQLMLSDWSCRRH